MFGKLFKGRRASQRKLTPDAVRKLVREFLDGWVPFRERYAQVGDVSVEWIQRPQGKAAWMASVTPAIDVRCSVVVADEMGQVTEARIVAMRQGAVLAQWRGVAGLSWWS